MKTLKPTISIIQKSRKANDNTQEVRIRVRFSNGPDDSYATGVALTKADFVDVFKKNNIRGSDKRAAYTKVNELYSQAIKLADEFNPTPAAFKLLFTGGSADMKSIQDCLSLVIEERKARSEKERKNYGYHNHNAVKNFIDREYKRPVYFTEIDSAWLKDWESRLYKSGVSINSVARYHNVLRGLFNLAIYTWKTVSPSLYPYGRGGFVVQRMEIDNDNFLRDDDWEKWMSYVPKNDTEQKAMDFWLLSYYLVGVNFQDIFTYRMHQIEPGLTRIRYIRSKSSRSKKVVKQVSKNITAKAREIIRKYMNKSLDPNAYLFPLVNDTMSYRSLMYKIKRFTAANNEVTKSIADRLGITLPVRTYTARHTASDMLYSNGASDAQVMELLDHTNPLTTQRYKHRMRRESQERLISSL